MLGFILELLLELLAEILLQLFAESLFELGFQSLAHSVRRGRTANPLLAAIGLLIIGAVAGFVTCDPSAPAASPGSPLPEAQPRPRAARHGGGDACVRVVAAEKRR